MPSKQEIEQYLNLMAKALSIAAQFSEPFPQMAACPDCDQTAQAQDEELDGAWGKGLPTLFAYLEQTLTALERAQDTARFIRAAAVCLWMDRKIHYAATRNPQAFSLYSLLPLSGNQPVCTDAINTNCAETGIQIHPRYEVAKFYDQDAGKLRPLSNRDAFAGLNGALHNVCYTTHQDGRYAIRHVILPYDYVKGKEDGPLKIAFSPISSSAHLLRCSSAAITRGGIPYAGIQVNGIARAASLQERFARDWRSACSCGADILFGPEMLGTAGLEERTGKYNKLLRRMSLDAMAEGIRPPVLTVLPSYWREGVNSVTVVYQDGSILGVQPKYTPYVDVANRRMEALLEQEERRLLMIHIPGVHRIVVMICADFLDIKSHETRKLICEELGATMILVPSYSQGEQDFINLLPSLKSYGATVVWGNCCGAARPPSVIGACSIAGTDDVVRFGHQCRCGGSCRGRTSCLFLVDLPMQLTRAKPDAPRWENPVQHILH